MYSIKITINEGKAKEEGFDNISCAQEKIDEIMIDSGLKPLTKKWIDGGQWFDGEYQACLSNISVIRKNVWFLNIVDDWILHNSTRKKYEDLLEEHTGRVSISTLKKDNSDE
nr:hypothetical protein [uncultured Butyrivibrio sp.]